MSSDNSDVKCSDDDNSEKCEITSNKGGCDLADEEILDVNSDKNELVTDKDSVINSVNETSKEKIVDEAVVKENIVNDEKVDESMELQVNGGDSSVCESVGDTCADHKEYHAGHEAPMDEYHYLKTGEYTSEMFKVIIKNIPNRISYGCFRSSMKTFLGFKPKKVKFDTSNSYAFLAFKNEEEREMAISKLNDRLWKHAKLECKKAAPAKDPFVREYKRKQKFREEHSKRQKLSGDADESNDMPPEEKILHVVCPYVSKSYEEQLSLKEQEMRSFVERLTGNLKANKIGADWLNKRKDKDLCMDLLPIIKSPILENYRNKVEFTIGNGPDKKDNTVGFRLGSYREGSLVIVEASKCINCNLNAIQIGKEFQGFIQNLPHPSYNPTTHVGLWQQLTVRTCTTGDLMAIVQVQPSFCTPEDFVDLQAKIVEFFTSAERSLKVTSIYISSSTQKNNNIDTFTFLAGEKYINEKLLGLQFRISPEAFFQVNTPGAEILYRTIHEWCDTDKKDACVLDVCCGTGTIGLCIANGTSFQVTGIEISQQAVDDAIYNAKFNGIENAKFVCGPAEEVIGYTVRNIKTDNVIAVVDPPRAGLRRNVIETLRACAAIKKIIYVSCSPKQASVNFISFCRPESKRFQGIPFKTNRAVAVDLFPHTPHCELIVELVRTNYDQTVTLGKLDNDQTVTLGKIDNDQTVTLGKLDNDQTVTTGKLDNDQTDTLGKHDNDQTDTSGKLDSDQTDTSVKADYDQTDTSEKLNNDLTDTTGKLD